MGVGYELLNQSKRERISFIHIPATKKLELAGNPVSAAIVTWYMLENAGDRIAFMSDTHDDWPFPEGVRSEFHSYTDVTDRVVSQLVEAGIVRDCGFSYVDPDEPDTVFMRDLRNVWMENEAGQE